MKRPFNKTVALNNATAVDVFDPGASATARVTRVTLSIVTHVAAGTFALQDSAGSPVTYAKHVDAAAAAGVPSTVSWDFGKFGVPMTAGKKVQVIGSASGITGYAYVEGYKLS
jgi:hypothetical protein